VIGHLSRRTATGPALRTYPENVEVTGIGTTGSVHIDITPADRWKDTH